MEICDSFITISLIVYVHYTEAALLCCYLSAQRETLWARRYQPGIPTVGTSTDTNGWYLPDTNGWYLNSYEGLPELQVIRVKWCAPLAGLVLWKWKA